MSSHADAGKKAFDESKYAEAIEKYTAALESSKSPVWLIQRSIAYQRTQQFDLALDDADAAVHAAIQRGKRELIGAAQFRRAVALYKMERYGDARICINWANAKNDKEKGLTMWMGMIRQAYQKYGEGDPKCAITVKEFPEILAKSDLPAPVKKAEAVVTDVQTPVHKIRYDWYQSQNSITISVMAKKIPKDAAKVTFRPRELEVSFPVGESSSYDLTLSPLHAEIDVLSSKYNVMSTKLEITLQKAVPGIKWPALEGNSEASTPNIVPSLSTNSSKPPVYPTSSKNGAKNWDAMKTFTMTDDTGKTENIEVKDDELDESDELNGFFKKLYKNSDPDTRRAMMKSYQESGGTSLSTNWADVGSKSFKPDENGSTVGNMTA